MAGGKIQGGKQMSIIIILGIVTGVYTVMAVICVIKECKGYGDSPLLELTTKMTIIAVVLMVILIYLTCSWMTCKHKMKLYNNAHGTNYTQEQFFWADETIREVTDFNVTVKE
jgi:H+/Cl- antiporter ClcA